MKISALIWLMAATIFAASCKKEDATKAPQPRVKPTKKAAMAASGGNANASAVTDERKPFVTDIKDVPLDEMPRVTIDVDLSNCMGAARWIDSKTPATPRIGAVSVDLSTSMAGETQPDPWVYGPVVNTATDGAVQAKGQHSWRLSKAATYTIDVIAYNVQSSAVESKLSSKIDFKSSNDISLKIVGTWAPSLVCGLKWQ